MDGSIGCTAPVFRFEKVSLRFDQHEVLKDVSLDVHSHRITVVTGPSGGGKTTLLRLCNRLEVPSSGRVLFRGADLSALDPLWLRRKVGMVFQRPTLFAGTVRDNLFVARPASDEEYRQVLESVGLPRDYLGEQGETLSGGEAQRACLARTLLTDPEVLLMDEPTSSLDAGATRVLEELTHRLASEGLTVLWVSHDLPQVQRMAGETVVLLEGRIATDEERERYVRH